MNNIAKKAKSHAARLARRKAVNRELRAKGMQRRGRNWGKGGKR